MMTNSKKVFSLRKKFSDVLDEFIALERFMYVLQPDNMKEHKYFTASGDLSHTGIEKLWSEINKKIKDFDHKRGDDLRPNIPHPLSTEHGSRCRNDIEYRWHGGDHRYHQCRSNYSGQSTKPDHHHHGRDYNY